MKITPDTLQKAIDIAKKQNMIVLRIDMSRINYERMCAEAHQTIFGFGDIPIRVTDHDGMLIAKQEDYQKMQEEQLSWRL